MKLILIMRAISVKLFPLVAFALCVGLVILVGPGEDGTQEAAAADGSTSRIDPNAVGNVSISTVSKLGALSAKSWRTGKWTTIATDDRGRVLVSPEVLPASFVVPDQPEPLWIATASEDRDGIPSVILTDGFGRVVVSPWPPGMTVEIQADGDRD